MLERIFMDKKQFLIYDIVNEAAERIPQRDINFHDVDVAIDAIGLESKETYTDIEKEAVILYLSRKDVEKQLADSKVENKYLRIKLEIIDNQMNITRSAVQYRLDKIIDLLNPSNGKKL